MYNKIVLAGGSGYLGQVLAGYYQDKALEIVILSRHAKAASGIVRYELWDGRTAGTWTSCLEGCELLVNLSGKNVNCRYNKKNRAEIFRSRLEPTALLGRVIAELTHPPRVWINCVSATIYRHAEDRSQDETHGEIGSGVSVEVCQAWEQTFFAARTPGTRKIALRTGIVFGPSDGVIPRLKNLVRLGWGGRQGNGQQYVSWIHELDFARITEWVMDRGRDGDIFNATAPAAIRNEALMKLLRKAYHVPLGLPSPAWLLRMGAWVIGTETELVLKSRWVYPERLLAAGFSFRFPTAAQAVRAWSGVEV